MVNVYNYRNAARLLRQHRQFQYGRRPGQYPAAYRMFTDYNEHAYTLYSYDRDAPLYIALFRESWQFNRRTPRAVFYNITRYTRTTSRQQRVVYDHINQLRAETSISTIYVTYGATLNAIKNIIRRTPFGNTNIEELVTHLVCVSQIARCRRETDDATSANTKKALRVAARQAHKTHDENLINVLPGNTMYNPEINGVYVY